VFRGVSAINVDAKGRMVLPTRFRERLSAENNNCIVLTIDTEDRCLLLYPLPIWEEIENKLAALPSFNPAARRIQRLLIGHATEIDIDNHSRILVPPVLREYCGLEKKAVLVGQGKKCEIWDEAKWNASRELWLAESAGDLSELPEEVKNISL
jgi:MraZ protein